MVCENDWERLKLSVAPATIIHCHKVAFAFIGIGHLIVKETQVDLSIARRRRRGENEEKKQKSDDKITTEEKTEQTTAGTQEIFPLPPIMTCASYSSSQYLI